MESEFKGRSAGSAAGAASTLMVKSVSSVPSPVPSCCYSENFNGADFANEQEMCDVVQSFEQLHRSIPWLAKAGVSSECHRGQLQILQAAIDYIIDLEEQLTDQLNGDFYRAALEQSFAAAAAASSAAAASVRRPFADVNAEMELEPYRHEQASPQISAASSAPQASATAALGGSISVEFVRKFD